MYDVTVRYSSEHSSLHMLLYGTEVAIDVRRYDVRTLPRDTDGLADWLLARWVEKDARMGQLAAGCTHALQPRDEPYRWASSGLTYRVMRDAAARGAAAERAEMYKQATVFGYYVNDPERFGVVEFDENWKAISIEEKPKNPKSNYAVTGLYFYPAGVSARAAEVKPSARGELEITTLNEMYLQSGELEVQLLGRGFAWLDTGTVDSLAEATDFVKTIQNLQGIQISAPEEIAYKNGWIDREQLLASAEKYGKSSYGKHLRNVAEGKVLY